MPRFPSIKLIAVAALLAAVAVAPAVQAAGVVRKPNAVEKRGITRWLDRHQTTDNLKAIIVHRKRPAYAAACFHHPQAGFEGTVLKRVGENRWKLVTGGSGWSGGKTLMQLLSACSKAAAPK